MTPLFDDYQRCCLEPSDINEHLPTLHGLASECTTIVEFGVRTGKSTAAFLAGLEMSRVRLTSGFNTLFSYDIEQPQCSFDLGDPIAPKWEFQIGDTAHLGDIPECDLLFIDTAHTCAHVTAELQYHTRVRRWIVFHDTILWGIIGMDGKPGVLTAAMNFLAAHPEWRVHSHAVNNNGLLVLERVR